MPNKTAFIIGGFFVFAACIFVLIGLVMAFDQQHVIKSYRSVAAVVLSSRIATISGHHGDTYKPVIRYQYSVAGHVYSSQRVTTIGGAASYSWAQGYIMRFPPGTHCTAYYDPKYPVHAVLDRKPSFLPYGLILFMLPFLAIGSGFMRAGFIKTNLNLDPQSQAAGWFSMKPESSLASRERFWMIVALLFDGVILLIFGHYYSLATPPYGLFVKIITGVCAVLALVPLILIWRLIRIAGVVQDGSLELNQKAMKIGLPTMCRVEQVLRRSANIRKVTLTIACRRIYQNASQNANNTDVDWPWKQEQIMAESIQASTGETLKWTAVVTPPSGWPASSVPDSDDYPKYRYMLQLQVQFQGEPKYTENFIVQLTGGLFNPLEPSVGPAVTQDDSLVPQ